jgi:hypothetical protein
MKEAEIFLAAETQRAQRKAEDYSRKILRPLRLCGE